MRSRGGPHFLAVDAFQLIENQVRLHPIIGPAILLGLFGLLLGFLKQKYDRLTVDVVVFAIVAYVIGIIVLGLAGVFFHVGQ